MRATVTYPYRDRETLEVHRTGDEVELTAERFAELSAAVAANDTAAVTDAAETLVALFGDRSRQCKSIK